MRVRDRSDYGQRLFEARQHAGMSQTKLAEAAGMAQSTLAGLEKTGDASGKTATLAQLCGVNVRWLERGEGPMLPDAQALQAGRNAAEGALPAPGSGADYRSIVLALAEALEKSKTQISLRQFVTLVEETYASLRR